MRIHFDGSKYHASTNGKSNGTFSTHKEADNANERAIYRGVK